jgi:predicted acylesterase/phospholipase RssA
MPDQSRPECDLVMKGGITSGIVYPPAVLELHKYFAFKNIGGTSAGAMAAAVTAAAESNAAENGFQELSQIHEELGKDGNMLQLFQPQANTRPLFDILLELLHAASSSSEDGEGQSASPHATSTPAALPPLPLFLRLLQTILAGKVPAGPLSTCLQIVNALSRKWVDPKTAYRPFIDGGRRGLFIAGGSMLFLLVLPSITLVAFTLTAALNAGQSVFWLPLGIFGLLTLALVALAGWAGLWIGRVGGVASSLSGQLNKEQFYGICNGHTPVPDEQNDHSNLTDWLSYRLDRTAGVSTQNASGVNTPLTFQHLSTRDINLQMVTSNISLGQPCVMPQDLANYLFHEDEWRQLFPDYVVEHMINHPPRTSLVNHKLLPAKFHFLPDAEQLPVIVCTRMSLSFPLLLCGISLYTLSTEAYERCQSQPQAGQLDPEQDLQRHWFSDGGIASNFPIHFFDAWLPRRPTFGINLTEKSSDTSALSPEKKPVAAVLDDGANVYLPPAEVQPAPEWHEIGQVVSFALSIFGTAQNYRDTLQSQLPSYRERIVQIRLDKNEGGMYLTMNPATIAHASRKGTQAAQVLHDQFDFDQHWWVRFLVLMSRLEEQFELLQQFFGEDAQTMLAARIRRACSMQEPRYPYARSQRWCGEAIARMELLENFMGAWQEAVDGSGMRMLFRENEPLPKPVLRVAPEL